MKNILNLASLRIMTSKKLFIADSCSVKKKPNLYSYTHIRGYHACRPIDPSLYYKKGIMALHNDLRRQSAVHVFQRKLEDIIENEDESFAKETSQVYFTAFKEELIESSGHYLCYGSEYLASIASGFDRNIYGKYHNILLKTGTPTIFICDVPIDFISAELLDDLISSYNPKDTNLGFWINQTLPPEFIVAHEHPSRIFDPLCYFYRTNAQCSCPLCV
ncbi:hypothetical protein LJC36_03685 [Desulfovibrio sp. OttesenSCG-928-C14]|nr:hypothetical protein [Desulfovibrio sp. OttesenSCG-928-C14]